MSCVHLVAAVSRQLNWKLRNTSQFIRDARAMFVHLESSGRDAEWDTETERQTDCEWVDEVDRKKCILCLCVICVLTSVNMLTAQVHNHTHEKFFPTWNIISMTSFCRFLLPSRSVISMYFLRFSAPHSHVRGAMERAYNIFCSVRSSASTSSIASRS